MIRLHGYFRSSAAWRCRIALNLKGMPWESVPVSLRAGQQHEAGFAALNPQRLVPALETDSGVLTQSLAIIEWLDETCPTPPLLPASALDRAHVRAFALAIACDIHPLQNLRVLDHLRNRCGLDEPRIEAWLQRWIGEGLSACNRLLQSRPPSRFCFGDRPGLADICLVPQIASAKRFGVDLSGLPRLLSIANACAEFEEFAAAVPSRQSDAI